MNSRRFTKKCSNDHFDLSLELITPRNAGDQVKVSYIIEILEHVDDAVESEIFVDKIATENRTKPTICTP